MDSIKIKLAVDRSRNRVLFADAGSDFVDVLLSFLTLPLSAIQFCAASSPGCLSNLCDSVSRLTGGKLLKVDACHGMLLTPSTAHEFGGGRSDFCDSYGTFVKNQPNLQVHGDFCRCWLVMARLVHVYNRVSSGSGMFVRCKEQFMISDDWTIMPASTGAMQSLARNFGPGAILHDFEELEVCVGWTEVVSMLKASLSSDTIFTDVFLPMGTADQDALATVKPSIHKKIVVTSNEDSGPRAPLECKIKLFYDGQEKKVMYAECKHEFVDLLLGFLAYPLGCVIKNMYDNAVTSPLGNGGFDNLYISVGELDAAGFIIGDKTTETLLNPPLSPFSVCAKFAILKDPFAVARQKTKDPFAVEPLNYMGLVGLVEDRNYLVDDDLLMRQVSGMSVSKHWCRRDEANVVEMEITIGKPEAVELLRAMLTSKTPLTDVFNDRLEEHYSLQKMQISVELPTGKIITVEVSRFDYIDTVKSRIMLEVLEVPIPAGRRHVLIWGAETLEDSCTVDDYNLVPGCTITCGFQVDNDDVYELLV